MKSNIHFLGLLMISLLSLFLFACGSGGGGNNSSSTQDDTTYNINGLVQKGPFIKGSIISIQELDKNLVPIGKTYSTETTDDLGKFTLQSKLNSPYVEITASGYYFDEVTGVLSTAPLTLRTIADLSPGGNVNINILTTLEKNRLIMLVLGGKAFATAKTQAEGEILNIFNIKDNLAYFETMDISKQGDSNGILLAISAILDNIAVGKGSTTQTTVAELSQLIASISSDIESDGILDSTTYKADITNYSKSINLTQVKQNLLQRYSNQGVSVTVPSFENFIDSDGDGKLNKDDFVISFNWVSNGELSTTYVSNAVTVVLPSGTTSTATLTDTVEGGLMSGSGNGYCGSVAANATVMVNGVDSGNKTANLLNGDTIAIKLTSSASYNCDAYNSVTVAGNTGGFGVRTKMMPLSSIGAYSGSYTGLVLSADGTKAYLTGSKKLQILDVSASSPTLLGEENSQVTTPSGNSSSGKDITISGNRLNIALNSTALQFLDASNPSSPTILSTFSGYGIDNCGGYMSAVAVSPDGNKVYGTDSCSHFFILDLSNPTTPVMLKNYNFNMADQIVISQNGQKAFAAAGNVLNIIDISNSNSPVLLSQSTAVGAIGVSGLTLSSDETKIYTSGCNGLFNVLDVTNSSSPALLSTLGSSTTCSSGDGGDSIDISGDGKRVYVGSGTIFKVIDVSNPTKPYLIGNSSLTGNAHGIALSPDETKTYIATDGGLQIIKLQ